MNYIGKGFLTMSKAGYKKQIKADKAIEQAKKSRSKNQEQAQKVQLGTGFLNKLTARKGYVFFSDHFMIDDSYATILTVFNKDGSDDNLPPMWGISLIPRNLGKNVVTHLLTQVSVAEPKWVESKQMKADDRSKAEQQEAAGSSRSKDKIMANKKLRDLEQIALDITAGDSYMHVAFKVLIKAPTLDELEIAIERLRRDYDTTFGAVYTAPFEGRQRDDFSRILRKAEDQIGSNYMFTATEFAGAYNIVTHGIEDVNGEYVGVMRADVNTAAVLWDIDNYDHHAIVATSNPTALLGSPSFTRERSSTLWGAKVSQAALMNNHRVVHFVLNGSDVTNIGVDLSDITSRVSMSDGDINPFEMFGNPKNELGIFAANIEKIKLMAKQMQPDLSDVALNTLSEELNRFYIDKHMWVHNASENRERLRIVGIPHKDVPKLETFAQYLDVAYTTYIGKSSQDTYVLQALTLLKGLFHTMLDVNNDLFNKVTSDAVDDASVSARVIYDLSDLLMRGTGVAMAQFVNSLGYATSALVKGDVVMIHGADKIDRGVFDYTRNSIRELQSNGVRVVYLYDSVEGMLEGKDLNVMDRADWILTGNMTNKNVTAFQKELEVTIPDTLSSAITAKSATQYYLRRDTDNIIFDADLVLG